MKDGFVLFYDSGIGGLTTLKKSIELLKNENFLYFADDKNCPYGNKTKEEISVLVEENLKQLLKNYDIKIVVFACNTITACCIEKLRKKYEIDFIGIEPAVSLADKESKSKEILVVATKATIEQEKYRCLVNKAKSQVYSLGLENLANDIESFFVCGKRFNKEFYVEYIKKCLFEHKNIDSIVLGCTHYCFIKKFLEEKLGVLTYDGNLGVAKRLKEVLIKKNKENDLGCGLVKIVLSSGEERAKKAYKKLLERL